MDTLKAIQTRRSIRKYIERSVEKEKVEILLRAAMAAPSAGNQQPWDFIAITQKEIINRVSRAHRYAKLLEGAPLCIIVCGNTLKERTTTSRLRKVFPRKSKYWVLACAAATENILLSAHAMGLGAVWIGIYPEQKCMRYISRIFGLPKIIKPMAAISIGYPGEEKGPADRFNNINIHWEKW